MAKNVSRGVVEYFKKDEMSWKIMLSKLQLSTVLRSAAVHLKHGISLRRLLRSHVQLYHSLEVGAPLSCCVKFLLQRRIFLRVPQATLQATRAQRCWKRRHNLHRRARGLTLLRHRLLPRRQTQLESLKRSSPKLFPTNLSLPVSKTNF